MVRYLAELDPSTLKVKDKQGRDALTLAKSSRHKAVQQWANTHGCELGRYRVDDDQIHHRCARQTHAAEPVHRVSFPTRASSLPCTRAPAEQMVARTPTLCTKTSCKAYPRALAHTRVPLTHHRLC
jgi:hypothetical protein